jgi:AAA+ ATPase superfamily predicted ATPase
VLQKLWDHRWQRDKGFMLVLCGSYVGFMEREVLGAKSPLFGRRTGQLKLGPLDHKEAGAFFPHWDLEERARAWFLCGGVPAYLKAFDPGRSVEQNLISAFLEVDAPLMREAEFLLREELRDVGSYATLVEALAQGQTTPTLLSKFAGIPVPRVMFFLKTLLELGYIERREPLVPGRPSRKLARYAVVDPVLRFWFRFVAPNFSAIRLGPPRTAFLQLIAPHLDAFYGAGFEALCREALPRQLEREGLDGSARVGEFWSPTSQIDVVALRNDRWTLLGECKWGTVTSLPKLEAELRAKAATYPVGATTLDLRVFVRRALKGKAPPGVTVHTLAELYR